MSIPSTSPNVSHASSPSSDPFADYDPANDPEMMEDVVLTQDTLSLPSGLPSIIEEAEPSQGLIELGEFALQSYYPQPRYPEGYNFFPPVQSGVAYSTYYVAYVRTRITRLHKQLAVWNTEPIAMWETVSSIMEAHSAHPRAARLEREVWEQFAQVRRRCLSYQSLEEAVQAGPGAVIVPASRRHMLGHSCNLVVARCEFVMSVGDWFQDFQVTVDSESAGG